MGMIDYRRRAWSLGYAFGICLTSFFWSIAVDRMVFAAIYAVLAAILFWIDQRAQRRQ